MLKKAESKGEISPLLECAIRYPAVLRQARYFTTA